MRSRRPIGRFIAGAALIVLGGGYALLPDDWIEENFQVEPDGGHGLVEFAVPVVLVALGALLVVRALLARRAAARPAVTDAGSTTVPRSADE